MKTLLPSAIVLLCAVVHLEAQTASVVVAMRAGYEDQAVTVPIFAQGAPGIAAAACRVSFNTAALEVQASSQLFGTFATQFQQSGVTNPRALTATVGAITFDAPFLVRTHPGGLTLAGARNVASTLPNPEIFSLTVRLRPGAPTGLYPITLDSAFAFSSAAGYPPGGERVPLLVGRDVAGNVFPTLAEIIPGNRPVADGSVRFYPADTDGDGLFDAWELLFFGHLGAASAMTDGDHDGLSDLLEQLFVTHPRQPNGSAIAQAVIEGGFFKIRFPKRNDSDLIVEASVDLQTWSAAGVLIVPRPDLGSGPDWTMHEASTTTAGRPRLLMRVRALSPLITP